MVDLPELRPLAEVLLYSRSIGSFYTPEIDRLKGIAAAPQSADCTHGKHRDTCALRRVTGASRLSPKG